jgi:two-component system NarL family sensor kinase
MKKTTDYRAKQGLYLCIFLTLIFQQCTNSISEQKAELSNRPDSVLILKNLDLAFELFSSDPDSALLVASEAQLAAEAGNYPQLQTDALNQMAKIYEVKAMTDTAEFLFRKARTIDEKSKFSHGIARDNYALAELYKQRGEYDSASKFINTSLSIWQKMPDKKKVFGDALIKSGLILEHQSYPDSALKYYNQALLIAREINSPKLQSSALLSKAIVYHSQRLYKLAIEASWESLKIEIPLRNSSKMVTGYTNLGAAYHETGKIDSALKYYRMAWFINDSLSVLKNQSALCRNISIIYDQKNKPDSAKYWLYKAIDISGKMDEKEGLAIAYTNLGELLFNQKDKNTAFNYLKKADSLGRSLNNFNIQIKARDNLARYYEDIGNYDSAYYYKSASKELSEEWDNRSRRALELEIAFKEEQNKRIQAESERDRKEASLTITYIIIVGLVVVFLVIILFLIRARRTEREKQRTKLQVEELLRSQEILAVQTMLETQEKERRRIAQDLHDSLGVRLSTAKLYYHIMETENKHLPPEEREQLHKANLMLDEACEEIRRVASNLHSGELVTFGVVKALETLCSNIAVTGKLKIDFQANGISSRLDNVTEFHIYQIVQELLANILRHSQATEVTVQLQRQNGTLNLLVEDNGIGFDQHKVQTGSGIGMKSLRERSASINASLIIDSRPGHGTTITLDIPVH